MIATGVVILPLHLPKFPASSYLGPLYMVGRKRYDQWVDPLAHNSTWELNIGWTIRGFSGEPWLISRHYTKTLRYIIESGQFCGPISPHAEICKPPFWWVQILMLLPSYLGWWLIIWRSYFSGLKPRIQGLDEGSIRRSQLYILG